MSGANVILCSACLSLTNAARTVVVQPEGFGTTTKPSPAKMRMDDVPKFVAQTFEVRGTQRSEV